MTRRPVGRGAGLAVAVVLTTAGCATVEAAYEDFPRMPGPAVTDVVPSEPPPPPAGTENLSPDGFDAVQRMAVRIRNVGCGSLSTGSGFAVDATTLITNRHVVADSDELQVSTYDGRDVAVTAASTAELADLAVVRTSDPLPSFPDLADRDPVRGDPVSVIGYPEGGALTITDGQVIGATTDPLNENLGEVLVADAQVEPGSSGSAVIDDAGLVVGVVYAKSAAGQSFIVPVSTLKELLADDAAFTAASSCGDDAEQDGDAEGETGEPSADPDTGGADDNAPGDGGADGSAPGDDPTDVADRTPGRGEG